MYKSPLSLCVTVCPCRYGPLVRYWCMHFEGKHSYFKDLAHRVKCFKNIPKTLANWHQEMICYQINSDHSTFFTKAETGPSKALESIFVFIYMLHTSFFHSFLVKSSLISNLAYSINLLNEFPELSRNDEIIR